MNHSIEIKDNKATFTITISAEDVTNAMKHAATHLAEHSNIPGFRPGKADYETIKKHIGAMKILEAATEDVAQKALAEAMLAEKLDTIGQPYFNMIKMVPEDDMVFTAELLLMPKIKKLADYNKLSVKKNNTAPTTKMIERAKKDLLAMQTKEIKATQKEILKKGDKAVVNLIMKKDGVVLEGGEGKNHGIYTAEDYFIPGFIEEILEMKEGEKRNFTLKFPKENFQKHLAGQDIDFEVELQEIFKLDIPKFDDDFAIQLGLKTKKELENKLEENLKIENEKDEILKQDRAVLELIAKKSEFEKLSDLLVNQEIEQMVHELKQSLTQQGVDFDTYLKQINKSAADIKLDMTNGAITRVKVSLVLREISKKEKIEVNDEELTIELDKIAEHYEDKETKEKIYSQQYKDYLKQQMKNKKVIDILKEKMVK